jgi:NTP pyrophosphatase (non-canonical NTP hydrolase)
MARMYTLVEAADALDADTKTLRRWLERTHINTDEKKGKLDVQTAIHDKRIKLLSEEQVIKLAQTFNRRWPPRPKTPAQAEAQVTGLPGAVNRLKDDVERLQEDHVSLTQFKDTTADVYDQLTNLWQLVKSQGERIMELEAWKATQESKPRAGRKPKTAGEAPAQATD